MAKNERPNSYKGEIGSLAGQSFLRKLLQSPVIGNYDKYINHWLGVNKVYLDDFIVIIIDTDYQ